MQTAKANRNPAEKTASQDTLLSCGKGILRGWGAQLVLGALLSLAAAGIAYSDADPDSVTPLLGLGATLLACLCGGFVAARTTRHSALLCGIGCGATYLLTAFLLSWLLPSGLRGQTPVAFRLATYGGILLSSIVGALCAVNLGTKSKKTRRRKRK